MNLLTQIKERRLRTGMKQWELARKCGISESLMNKYENQRTNIPEHVMKKIDRVLDKALEVEK